MRGSEVWLEVLVTPSNRLREVIGELNAVIAVMLRLSKTSKPLKTWSGRRGSNPRRPAWEQVRLFNLKDLCVSDALLRLKQASPNQQHPQQALLIKVQTRYVVCPYRYQFAKLSWDRNSNGSRWRASRKPKGVLREFLRSQFTSERHI